MFNQRRYSPMGVADLFDEAFDLYKSNFLLLLGTSAVVYVPLQALMMLVVLPQLTRAVNLATPSLLDFDQMMAYLTHAFTIFVFSVPIYAVAYTILSSASIYVVSQRYLERPATMAAGFLFALRKVLPLFAALLLVIVPVIVGYAVCALPGVYLFCRYLCLPQVVVLEPRQSPLAAARRAYRLTANYVWRCIGCLILVGVIELAIAFAIQGPLDLLMRAVFAGSVPLLAALASNKSAADQIAEAFAALLVSPFTFALLTVLYYDIRIRQEGYDMSIIAVQLGFSGDMSAPGNALPQAKPPSPGSPRRPFWQRRSRGAAA